MLLRKFIVIDNQFISIETVCSNSNNTSCITKLYVFSFTLSYDAVSFNRRITLTGVLISEDSTIEETGYPNIIAVVN